MLSDLSLGNLHLSQVHLRKVQFHRSSATISKFPGGENDHFKKRQISQEILHKVCFCKCILILKACIHGTIVVDTSESVQAFLVVIWLMQELVIIFDVFS